MGTTVKVELPVCAPPTSLDNLPQQPQDVSPSTILLVEDGGDARDMMASVLRSFGHTVLEAADGLDGCRIAYDRLPHAAIVDIGLPGIDGYEVARRLREHSATQRIRLIALTGYGQRVDKDRARAAGFDLHLVKPVDLGFLLTVLNSPDAIPHARMPG